MDTEPGLIVLLGSGETAPSARKVYHWLFEEMNEPIRMAILETPAGFEPNSHHVAEQIEKFVAKRLQNFRPRIEIAPARKRDTDFSPDDPHTVQALLEANVIMMGPGSPTYAARQLLNSVAWDTLLTRHRMGANLIISSASTIASSAYALPVYEIYKVGEDLHWKQGLNFFKAFGLDLVFIPHWNNNDGGDVLDTSHCYMGLDRYDQLIEMLPMDNPTIVGIDEQTALVINPKQKTCQVLGLGEARIIRDGQETVFPNGSTFATSEFGYFTVPQGKEGLPDEVWARAEQAEVDRLAAEAAKPKPSTEVMALVKQRLEARDQKDWAAADALRDEIEALGWRVLDTKGDPILEPV